MPKFGCSCGHIINLSADPCPYEFCVVPLDMLIDLDEVLGEPTAEAELDRVFEESRRLVTCSRCKALWLERKAGSGQYERLSSDRGSLSIAE